MTISARSGSRQASCPGRGGSNGGSERDGAVTLLAVMAAFYLAFYVARGRRAALGVGMVSLAWSVFGSFG